MIAWACLSFAELSPLALHDLLALRQAVFVVEQRCAYADIDGRDAEALHLLGRRGGALVAYARLLPPAGGAARIGRVVVAPAERGRGLGRELFGRALAACRERWDPPAVRLSAQLHLERFYRGFGFLPEGSARDEDGIPHVPMVRPR